MLPGGRSVRPGEGGSAAAWTGAKRRKTTTHPPSPVGTSVDDDADADVMMDDVQLQDPPEEDDGSRSRVFSAEDVITDEELAPYMRKVESRNPNISGFTPRISDEEELHKIFERFCRLRFTDYHKMYNPDYTGTAPADLQEYPYQVLDYDDHCDPDQIFDWTVTTDHFDLAGLTDYQRIVPTRGDYMEYYDWDNYSITFSNYETDEDYVKYCNELSKKIKWIEEYKHLDEIEFTKLRVRGFNQAIKIAAEFSHLPLSLAARGYKEYILCLRDITAGKEFGQIYFEVWKRMTKQKMSFRQALEESGAANMFPKRRPFIEDVIKGVTGIMMYEYKKVMDQIPDNVEGDDEVLNQITYLTSKRFNVKIYLDYVKKKLEIGRRLRLIPFLEQS